MRWAGVARVEIEARGLMSCASDAVSSDGNQLLHRAVVRDSASRPLRPQ